MLPGRQIVPAICVTHPLVACAVTAAPCVTFACATAQATDSFSWENGQNGWNGLRVAVVVSQ